MSDEDSDEDYESSTLVGAPKSRGGLSGHGTWLVSMTDMIAILLAFFVFLYTQTTRREETKVATTTIIERQPVEIRDQNYEQRTTERVDLVEHLSPIYLAEVFKIGFAQNPLLSQSIITETGEWVVISFPTKLLFEGGASRLSPAAALALEELATVLTNVPNTLAVVGHANPLPISTDLFPSNWHLSLARAEEVRRILIRTGYVDDIQAYGRSFADFSAIHESQSEEQKLRLAKRVDIVVFGRGLE